MKISSQQMAVTSLFIALTFLLGLTPLGIIPLGFINVTILCIPVIIGAIALGPRTGVLLGACFGLASTLRAFGIPTPASALVSTLMAASPMAVVAMSMIPRLLVPVVAYEVFHWVSRAAQKRAPEKHAQIALPCAAVAASLTNTIVYLGLMLAFYVVAGLDSAAILGVITGTGIIAGGLEALAAALITTPIVLALWKLNHPYIRRN